MQFAYWSIDDVNRELAQRLAARMRVRLDLCDFRDSTRAVAAHIYDLDSFPADRRAVLLAALRAARQRTPVAIHTYRLSAGAARALRRNGVIVVRRLQLTLFMALSVTVAGLRARRRKPRSSAAGVAANPRVPATVV